MATRMNSGEGLKAFCAFESESELSSLACTSSEELESDEEPSEKDFSDQEVGIHIYLLDNFFWNFLSPLLNFLLPEVFGGNCVWEFLQTDSVKDM